MSCTFVSGNIKLVAGLEKAAENLKAIYDEEEVFLEPVNECSAEFKVKDAPRKFTLSLLFPRSDAVERRTIQAELGRSAPTLGPSA